MALSANIALPASRGAPRKESFKVAGSVHIYAGAALGRDLAGYAKPFDGGDRFIGFATEEYYNTSTTSGTASVRGDYSLAGATDIQVDCGGEVKVTLAAVSIKDRGRPVFAVADNSFALIGHPDAFIGRITDVETTTTCWVQLKAAGELCPITDGVVQARLTGTDYIPNVITAGNEQMAYGFRLDAIGAGITAGAGLSSLVNVAGGEIKGLLDNDNEAQNVTIESLGLMAQTYGISIRMRGRLSVLGPTATTDFTVGLMTAASSTMTDAIRADTEVTTSGIGKAAFHVDGDSTNILIKTDDDTTVTSADTTIDNSLTVNKDLIVIVRPSGAVEFWSDGARLLSTVSYTVGSALTTYWCGIVNLEKSTGTDVAAFNVQLLEVKGASLPA